MSTQKIVVEIGLNNNVSKKINEAIIEIEKLNLKLKDKFKSAFEAGFAYAESFEMNTVAVDFETWYKNMNDDPNNNF